MMILSRLATKSSPAFRLPIVARNAAAKATGNHSTSSSLMCDNNRSQKRSVTTHSQLPEEHKMIYEMCRKFADEELAPNAGEWDQKHAFPTDAVNQLSELGLMGINTPEECDGSGLDALSYAIAMEEISR